MAITLTAGDTASVITAALTIDGAAYNLTDQTVQAVLKHRLDSSAAALIDCTFVGPRTSGVVSLSLPEGIAAGVYDIVFRVTRGGGSVLTFPNAGPNEVDIVPALT